MSKPERIISVEDCLRYDLVQQRLVNAQREVLLANLTMRLKYGLPQEAQVNTDDGTVQMPMPPEPVKPQHVPPHIAATRADGNVTTFYCGRCDFSTESETVHEEHLDNCDK